MRGSVNTPHSFRVPDSARAILRSPATTFHTLPWSKSSELGSQAKKDRLEAFILTGVAGN